MGNFWNIKNEYQSMDRFMKKAFNSPSGKIRLLHPSIDKKDYENRHVKNLIEDGMIIQTGIASSTFYMLTRKGRLKHMKGGYWSEYLLAGFNKFMKGLFAIIIALGAVVGMIWTYCELFQPQCIPKYKKSTQTIECRIVIPTRCQE